MAFQQLKSATKFVTASCLEEGKPLQGYILKAVESTGYPGKFDLCMRHVGPDLEVLNRHKDPAKAPTAVKVVEGEEYVLSTSGNLKWKAKDMHTGREQGIGLLAEITRKPSVTKKGGVMSTDYDIGVDAEKKAF